MYVIVDAFGNNVNFFDAVAVVVIDVAAFVDVVVAAVEDDDGTAAAAVDDENVVVLDVVILQMMGVPIAVMVAMIRNPHVIHSLYKLLLSPFRSVNKISNLFII